MKKNKLDSLVGLNVSVCNVGHDEMIDSRIDIRVFGTLESVSEPDSETRYYVRVNETSAGPSGVGFLARHVAEIVEHLYYSEIVLLDMP